MQNRVLSRQSKGLLLLLLLGFVVRIYALDGQSFWFDEGWSWHLARMPLGEMAAITAGDRSPVLYYTLLHAWMTLVGASEFALRYFSLLPDVLTVALVWAIGRTVSSVERKRVPRVARFELLDLLPALLYALCPFAVWYAQETRMYAQVALFCTASSYALLRWLGGRSPRWLIGSALCLAAAIHSHYYAVFLLPAQACVVGYETWCVKRAASPYVARLAPYGLSLLAVIGSVIPWLLYARGGFAYDDGFVFPLNTIDGRMLEWLRTFASGGFGYPLPDGWPIIAAGVAVIALRSTWRNPRQLQVLALALIPLLAAAIAVRVVYPYRSVFHPRYLIYIAPMLCVWLSSHAIGIENSEFRIQKRPRLVRAVFDILNSQLLIFLLWLPALYWHFTQPPLIRADTRGAVRHVVEALEPGDTVVMARDNFAVNYYWPKITAQVGKTAPLLAAPEGLHGVLHDDAGFIDRLNATQPKRVRLILWQDDVVDPQKLAESTLWRNGYQIGEYNFGRIRLPLYQITEPRIGPIVGQPIDILFGDQLLLKASWLRPQVTAGDWFYAVLWWQPTQPPPKDYKVFVHVLDAAGHVAFQDDRTQLNELLPMSHWTVGETLRAPHAMVSPANLPAGDYRVFVGVYDPVTGERLRTATGENEVLVGLVRINGR